MTRPAAAERPAVPALAGLEVYAGMAAGTHLLDESLAVREPEHDLNDPQLAWRLVTPCVPAECFHPIHGLGSPHGRAHLTWLWPSEPQPEPLESEPVR